MSGFTIFDAVTDIDDELIERAQSYRPRRVNRIKAMSGVLAAALVLMVSFFAAQTLRSGDQSTNTCDQAAPENTCDMAAPEAGFELAAEEKPEVKSITDGTPTESLIEFSVQNGYVDSEQKSVAETATYTVGELYGYVVELRDIEMGEYFISEYKIYVTKDTASYLLAQSLLNEAQRAAVEELVEEYLLREGMK